MLIRDVNILGHEQIKAWRLYIPPRDRRIEVKAKPALSKNSTHNAQFLNAFSIGFTRYKEAMIQMSKI